MTLLGALISLTVIAQISVFGRTWDVHTIAGSLLTIVGSQVIALSVCARAYGVNVLGERDRLFDQMRAWLRLEHGLLAGALVTLGFAFAIVIFARWSEAGFGALSETRLAIPAATLMIVGIQIFFTSFLLSILGLRRR
jgi:hypothetical protein